MFHSTDLVAAFSMAISEAISGSSIYLSDQPQAFAKHLIEPLCFKDDRQLRLIAPGTPIEEDLFYSLDEDKLLRIVAPLRNLCAAIAVFHLETDKKT